MERSDPAATALRCSIVVPVYNEGANIASLFREARQVWRDDYELLIVYDFPEDNTIAAIEALPATERIGNLRLIHNTLGRGVRFAIEAGMKQAAAPVVVVMMADLSDDFSNLHEMVALAEGGAAVVCSSRYMKGGRQIGGPFLKGLLSRLAGQSLYWLAGLPTHDPTNSYKAYRKEFLDRTPIESPAGFCLGMELTVKAHFGGQKVCEIPGIWRDRSEGESRFNLRKWLPLYLHWYFWAIKRCVPSWLSSWPLLIAAMLLLASPFLYMWDNHSALNPDPFLYSMFARQTLAGHRMYSEVWIDKPPMTVLAYAIPQVFVPRSYAAISFFGGIWIALVAGVFVWTFRRIPAAAMCCCLFLVLFPLSYWDYAWFSSEHISNLFVSGCLVLGYLFVRDRRFTAGQCLTVGMLTCAAFHVRQNTVLAGIVPVAGILLAQGPFRSRIRAMGMVAIGGLTMWALIMALVAWLGDLPQYFYMVFRYPSVYASIGKSGDVVALLEIVRQGILPYIVGIALLLAFRAPFRWLIVIAVCTALACCLMPIRPFAHYWVSCFPYVALLIGLAVTQAARMAAVLKWACVAGLFLILIGGAVNAMHKASQPHMGDLLERTAHELDRQAPPDATLLVWGPFPSEGIQFASRLPPAHTVFTLFVLEPPICDIMPWRLAQLFEQYLANPPGVILVHYSYLADPPPPDLANAHELFTQLTRRYVYRQTSTINNYLMFVRDRQPTTQVVP